MRKAAIAEERKPATESQKKIDQKIEKAKQVLQEK